ncbi:MAG: hypothetical protein KBS76_05165, partial [Ruminococcus sp.]|nr:hypothetical protein [Candidatus Apopatosoma intestinale]
EEPVEEEPVSVEESPLEEIDLLADATENGRSDGGSLAESELSWRGHLLDPKFARAVQRMDAETFRAYQDKITSAIERDLAESTEAAKQSEDMEKLVRRLANQVLRIKENNRVRRENGWAVLAEESIPQLVEKAEILSDKRRSALQKKTEAEQRMIRNTRLLEAVNMIRQNEDAESLPGGADLAKGRSLTDSAEGDDRNETRFKE